MPAHPAGFDRTGWLALGVFAGVILAQLLSPRLPSVAAWFLGGAVIGLAPAAAEKPRSARRTLVTVLCTAAVAAAAHGLAVFML
jgi:hypothetical protein